MESGPPDDPARPPRRLYPEELLRARRVVAYYDVLSRDEAFQAGLQQLFKLIRLPPFSTVQDPFLLPSPPARARPLLEDFVERWHLPRRHAVDDLWHSFHLADFEGTPPVLGVGGRSSIGPIESLIMPPLPLPFEYDPTHQNLDWVRNRADQIADEVRRSILEQAEDLEQVPGWRTIPTQHQDLGRLQRLALRLYRRAVLGWPWQRIAHQETEDTREYCDWQSVRTTVRAWSEELDVPLPERRGGRPSRQKPVS